MPIYRAVLRSTSKVSRKTISAVDSSATVESLDLQYQAGTRIMTFYGKVRSHGRFGTYNVQVTFKGVEKNQGLTDEEILQGFQPKPSLSENEVQFRCNCPNYRFRFDRANRIHGVGTGARFGYYRRKTNRAPYNPRNLFGCCAHLIETINYLQSQGFITE